MERLKRKEKCQLTEKFLQFGEGNFLRGFVDWMIDRLNKEADFDGGVVVVQPLAQGLIPMINEQDGLYTLYLRGLQDGQKVEETRVVDCITRGINPFENTDEFFECASNLSLIHIYTWFSAMLYLSDRVKNLYPLQYIIRQIVMENQLAAEAQAAGELNTVTVSTVSLKYATLFISIVPMLCVYPFIQKYFVKGVMVGSVKG